MAQVVHISLKVWLADLTIELSERDPKTASNLANQRDENVYILPFTATEAPGNDTEPSHFVKGKKKEQTNKQTSPFLLLDLTFLPPEGVRSQMSRLRPLRETSQLP